MTHIHDEDILTDSIITDDDESTYSDNIEDSIEDFVNHNNDVIQNCIVCDTNKQMENNKYCVMCINYECPYCFNPMTSINNKRCDACIKSCISIISNIIDQSKKMYEMAFNGKEKPIHCLIQYLKLINGNNDTLDNLQISTIISNDKDTMHKLYTTLINNSIINKFNVLTELLKNYIGSIIFGQYFTFRNNNKLVDVFLLPFNDDQEICNVIIKKYYVKNTPPILDILNSDLNTFDSFCHNNDYTSHPENFSNFLDELGDSTSDTNDDNFIDNYY